MSRYFSSRRCGFLALVCAVTSVYAATGNDDLVPNVDLPSFRAAVNEGGVAKQWWWDWTENEWQNYLNDRNYWIRYHDHYRNLADQLQNAERGKVDAETNRINNEFNPKIQTATTTKQGLEAKLPGLRQEAATLPKANSDAQATAEKAAADALREKEATWRTLQETSAKEKADLEAPNPRVVKLRADYAAATEEIAGLKAKLSATSAHLTAAKKKYEEAVQTRDEVIRTTSSQNSQKKAELEQAQQKWHADLQVQRDANKQLKAAIATEKAEVRRRVEEALTAAKAELAAASARAEQETASMRTELKARNSDLAALTKEATDAASLADPVVKTVADLEQQLGTTVATLSGLERNHKAQVDGILASIRETEQMVGTIDASIREAAKQENVIQVAAAAAEAKAAEIKKKMESLQKQLEKAAAASSATKAAAEAKMKAMQAKQEASAAAMRKAADDAAAQAQQIEEAKKQVAAAVDQAKAQAKAAADEAAKAQEAQKAANQQAAEAATSIDAAYQKQLQEAKAAQEGARREAEKVGQQALSAEKKLKADIATLHEEQRKKTAELKNVTTTRQQLAALVGQLRIQRDNAALNARRELDELALKLKRLDSEAAFLVEQKAKAQAMADAAKAARQDAKLNNIGAEQNATAAADRLEDAAKDAQDAELALQKIAGQQKKLEAQVARVRMARTDTARLAGAIKELKKEKMMVDAKRMIAVKKLSELIVARNAIEEELDTLQRRTERRRQMGISFERGSAIEEADSDAERESVSKAADADPAAAAAMYVTKLQADIEELKLGIECNQAEAAYLGSGGKPGAPGAPSRTARCRARIIATPAASSGNATATANNSTSNSTTAGSDSSSVVVVVPGARSAGAEEDSSADGQTSILPGSKVRIDPVTGKIVGPNFVGKSVAARVVQVLEGDDADGAKEVM